MTQGYSQKGQRILNGHYEKETYLTWSELTISEITLLRKYLGYPVIVNTLSELIDTMSKDELLLYGPTMCVKQLTLRHIDTQIITTNNNYVSIDIIMHLDKHECLRRSFIRCLLKAFALIERRQGNESAVETGNAGKN